MQHWTSGRYVQGLGTMDAGLDQDGQLLVATAVAILHLVVHEGQRLLGIQLILVMQLLLLPLPIPLLLLAGG